MATERDLDRSWDALGFALARAGRRRIYDGQDLEFREAIRHGFNDSTLRILAEIHAEERRALMDRR